MIDIDLNDEKLIKTLDAIFSKIEIRNPNSPDFKLSDKELFFKLGQRSVVDFLLDCLERSKKGES